ncbi:hypothetical protein NEFER03_2161 [Nematocida sp. LUAm3]|nr:hypothetical protein NEFER03_2161 [Nematocida sp. LUAm3]KAI5174632.1 hypothetical protein NEFER02_0753 [Nematocida sp. LUAm2]KAI5177962.1 hypothetical protein NEFER01_1144 [Nematocida sp. LUAm1]
MGEKGKIKWGAFSVLITLLVFIGAICIVVISMLPFIDASATYTDLLPLLIGLANVFRMIEFLFIDTPLELFIWIINTIIISIIGGVCMNYDSVMGFLQNLEASRANTGQEPPAQAQS